MTTIVTRAGKGSSLTWTEMDANFTNLNTDKYQSGASPTFAAITATAKQNFTVAGSIKFQDSGVDAGGFYAPQTYSKYMGVGVTTDRTWSNTLINVFGAALGPQGETSLLNYGQSTTYLAHGVYVGSDYGLKYTTNSLTPAYISMSGGQITFNVSATNGTAGNAATFNTPLRVYGSDQSVRINDEIVGAVQGVGFRNRIINGDMRIDQRSAGAAVTINNNNWIYGVDRWAGYGQNADGVFTITRSTSTPPTGFTHFLRVTTTTADASIGAAQLYLLRQAIEGYNISDLAWGTASAKTVTLSFLVRSSLTGTFSGSVMNSAGNMCYPFTFTISQANTWETKTVTIAGPTSGTFLTDNTSGILVIFDLGCGTSGKGTAGAWTTSAHYGATGAVNLIGTLSATLDFTGVQFEAGPVASPFERIPINTQIDMCQRYYEKSYNLEVAPGTATTNGNMQYFDPTTGGYLGVNYATRKRTTATSVTIYSPITGASGKYRDNSSGADFDATTSNGGEKGFAFLCSVAHGAIDEGIAFHWAATAEL